MAFDINAAAQRALQNVGATKRGNKNQSGRAGRRTARGQATLAAVGGLRNDVGAIYAPADKKLCVVVDDRRGWLEDGRPRREPRVK